jgi:4-aminobutyrate aminotransferase-like enzyme
MSIPGPRSAALAKRLREHEQRNLTFLADDFPVFWDSAYGSTVIDVDGNRYIDCTAAFGVANTGHSNPHVMKAVAAQAQRLAHGMGDVHPTEIRVRLFERLATILPPELPKMFLTTSGSDAIEAALKNAMLATGRSRFAAYRGAYHGLSFGALAVGGIERFRNPFARALHTEPLLLDYPRNGEITASQAASQARDALKAHDPIAALVIEPVQGRAGCIVPPFGYLRALRELCYELEIVFIVDEIFTGFGRTGRWFCIEHENVVPDILCIGKAMGSGVPISAAIGRKEIMDAWPESTGEALHTSTYLGNPLACAAALATIDELERRNLPARAAALGKTFDPRIRSLSSLPRVTAVRGSGLFWGVEFESDAVAAELVRRCLRAGVIFLQSGTGGNTIAISPPLVIEEAQLAEALDVFKRAIQETT